MESPQAHENDKQEQALSWLPPSLPLAACCSHQPPCAACHTCPSHPARWTHALPPAPACAPGRNGSAGQAGVVWCVFGNATFKVKGTYAHPIPSHPIPRPHPSAANSAMTSPGNINCGPSRTPSHHGLVLCRFGCRCCILGLHCLLALKRLLHVGRSRLHLEGGLHIWAWRV